VSDLETAVCVDIGSTYTKAALVDLGGGVLLGTAAHPTTLTTDVMDGVRGCVAELTGDSGVPLLACSSAGGGLRVAVVGNEQLVTAEAGRRVALSSGGHVVAVLAGGLAPAALEKLGASTPDVVLLVGGTDGGNAEALLADAEALAGWHTPVVVAGNRDAVPAAAQVLTDSGTPCRVAANVMPRIGVLDPEPARAAVRAVFLEHVIGGKHLSRDSAFQRHVRGATPDVVLRAVELLARGPAPGDGRGDVVLVDVGGATTDVYSVVERTEESEGAPSRDVLGNPAVSRTVEGDLGVRWSAPGTVTAAIEAGWVDRPEEALAAATRRRDDPGLLAEDPDEREMDVQLASWALGLAVRRHAGRARPRYEATGPGRGRWIERAGVDLREVRLVVGSGGVLRHAVQRDPSVAGRFVSHLEGTGGWQVPRDASFTVDSDYVWAAAGLLAEERPDKAWSLLASVGHA
jgi:uncharacterized protein (TIGR01319 family)